MMPGAAPRPRLLLSRAALDLLGDALPPRMQVVLLDDVVGAGAPDLDAAFLSRDITGLATKHELTAGLRECHRLLRESPRLAWVHTHSAGADRAIYAELRGRGVAVTTSSGANAEVVAQTALGALLALARGFPALRDAQSERRWAPLVAGPAPRDLAGQTVVLVGWGPIAQTLQPLLSLLKLNVVVVRRRAAPAAPGLTTLPFERLHEALPAADWLLLACPLTDLTRGAVDARALRLLPPRARLINVARGEIVVERDLVAALKEGRLGGAFLDVFEHEPLAADSPLWTLPQVMVTPHSAGHADANAARVAAMFNDNLQRWLSGQALRNTVP